MQDFRVKSGLQVSGNIYGINYLTAGNITVTYSGSFGNLTVGGQLVANVTGTVSSLNNFTTANLAEGTNLYYRDSRAYANLTLASIDALSDVNTVTVTPLMGYGLIWNGSEWAPNVITVSDIALANVANSVLGIVQQSIASFQANTAKFAESATTANVANSSVFATTANVANTVLTLDNFTTSDLSEGNNLYFTSQRAIGALAGNNVTVNNLTVSGDLEVQGNTVTINTATLTIEDKNIVLANGATNASQANGAGITIAGANAEIKYISSTDTLLINKALDITDITLAANTETTGALQVAGGAYIAGNLIVGGDIYVHDEPVVTLNPLNQSIALLRSYMDQPVGNVLYVTGNGNDNNSGHSFANALANIHTALNRAQPWTTVFVKSGDYLLYEQPVTIKNRVGLVGDNLRTTTIRPAERTKDMFYVNNASYVTGITFRDHLSPSAVFSYNPDGSAGFISTSPYIQNSSSITTTGTGMRVDGNYVSGLRSMVCDSYTNTNEGGIGIHMLNRGYTQLVSVFTICCDIAILCENGGFCSITNSNASFGRLGLLARGVSSPLNFGKYAESFETDEGTQYLITNLNSRPNYGDVILFANYDQAKCSRDTGLIIDSLAFDLAYQSNTQSAFAGLQYWSQSSSAIPNQSEETIAAFNYAKDLSTNVAANINITAPRQGNVNQTFGNAGAWVTRISDGFDLVANVITGGTVGITDRIIPNTFPANTNVAVNNAANLVIANKEFIQKEVISFVNQEYPGFFANATNFIDAANAITKCERDTGYLIDSIIFDFLHNGNRQAITSGVYYYTNDFNSTQIEDQVVQTTAAYDFIGTIIDDIVRNKKVAAYNQEKCERDTKLIVDSIAFDLGYTSNTQSNFAGLQYWAQTSSAIPNQSEETVAAIAHVKVLAANIAQNITIASPKQANVLQVSGTGGTVNESNIITNNFNLVIDIINNGTVGISDRIISNKFPANTNVAVNNAANLVLLNRSFIQAETIAYVNQTYPGFFANANNFIDVANAQTKCARDVGYILDSTIFDLRHDGNRQSVQSGVFYYNFSTANTQINEQIVQTGAAYNFIGTIIDEIVRGIPVANVRQNVFVQNTTAASAATLAEANIALQKISLITNIITNGPNVALAKISIDANVATISTNVSNAVKLILANKDFIAAETIEFVNATLFDPPYQSVYTQDTTSYPAASLAEANVVLQKIDLITDIITLGANAAPVKSPISYSTLSTSSNVINAAKIILANRDYIVAEVNGYINRNWANISNGTVAFYTVANSTPMVSNTSLVTLLEGATDTVILANSSVSFHQPSYISALGYTFEYIGSGTNIQTALPYNGGFPIQENEVTEEKGGRVYFTSTDQQGDFRIGTELVFNRVDGTISGRTFNKALFAVMTPYILAIEG
jgi:hypothetical protein